VIFSIGRGSGRGAREKLFERVVFRDKPASGVFETRLGLFEMRLGNITPKHLKKT